jgi:hypothetical protein
MMVYRPFSYLSATFQLPLIYLATMPIRLRAKSRDFGAGHAINKGTMRVNIPCLATNRIGMVSINDGYSYRHGAPNGGMALT